MKYHALFVIFEKAEIFFNCHLLQIIGGALRVKGKQIWYIYNIDWELMPISS